MTKELRALETCFNCGNADHSEGMIECLLRPDVVGGEVVDPNNVCDDWESE